MWTWTCCWTDHSKGCPLKEIGGYKPYSGDTEEIARKFYDDFLAAKARLGYEVDLTRSDADFKTVMRYQAEFDEWKA